MISSEVQRTLVKSPPELWTELSDPAALGRHLGEFGEIRITRVEPEKAVEWEAEKATGTVLIKPSGWGTRVTLTVSRELPAQEEPAASAPAAAEPRAAAEEPAVAPQSEPELDAPAMPQVPKAATEAETAAAQQLAERGEHWQRAAELQRGEPQSTSEDEAAASREQEADWEDWQYDAKPKTEPRRGFLARLLGWRHRERAAKLDQPAGAEDAEQWPEAEQPLEEESYVAVESDERARHRPVADGSPAPAPGGHPATAVGQADIERPQGSSPDEEPAATSAGDAGAEPGSDISAELKAAQEVAAEEVAAVLSAMLDRLGTAHHRPFSRA